MTQSECSDTEGVEPLFEQIQNEEVQYPEGLQLSQPLQDLLDDIFIKDPAARIQLEHLETPEWVQVAKREEEEAHRKLQEEARAAEEAEAAATTTTTS